MNNSGIDCRNSAGGHKFCNWDTISRIVENNEALYLYYGRNCAFIVPKRFLSQAETDTVKQLCLLKSRAGSINGKLLDKK